MTHEEKTRELFDKYLAIIQSKKSESASSKEIEDNKMQIDIELAKQCIYTAIQEMFTNNLSYSEVVFWTNVQINISQLKTI